MNARSLERARWLADDAAGNPVLECTCDCGAVTEITLEGVMKFAALGQSIEFTFTCDGCQLSHRITAVGGPADRMGTRAMTDTDRTVGDPASAQGRPNAPPAVATDARTGPGAYPSNPETATGDLSGSDEFHQTRVHLAEQIEAANEAVRLFERLLADPHEQFDPRGDLLASIQRYAGAAPMAAGGSVVNGPPGEVVYGDPPARVQAAALRAYADRHHPGAEGFAQRVEYGTGVEYDAACTGCGGSWSDDDGGCIERAALLADAAAIEAGRIEPATPDANEAARAGYEQACGCGELLDPDGPSAWFAGEECQRRWHGRQAHPALLPEA